MTEYAVVIERSPNNYGAWVPDLDGCVSTGKTLEEVKVNITEAIDAPRVNARTWSSRSGTFRTGGSHSGCLGDQVNSRLLSARIHAHRGASMTHPENTLASFVEAR
jgi:hypothetical protein